MLAGIFPVLPTLFKEHGQVSVKDLRQVIRFALACQADGLVFPGVASEYNYLSDEERGHLLAIVVDEVNDRVPVVGGASAASIAEAIQLGGQALSLGVRHLMVMAPAHLGDDVPLHQRFFEALASELPGVEIIFQNAPAPIGAGLSPQASVEIAKTVPAIRYIKEETLPSGPRISELVEHAPESVVGVFGGGGARYIVDELNRGAVGAIPAVELTDLHVTLFRAHQNNDASTARRLYRLSLPLLVAQANYRMRLTKYVLGQRGICHAEYVRAPLPGLDAGARRDIDQMLADLRDAAHSEGAFNWTEASSCTT